MHDRISFNQAESGRILQIEAKPLEGGLDLLELLLENIGFDGEQQGTVRVGLPGPFPIGRFQTGQF